MPEIKPVLSKLNLKTVIRAFITPMFNWDKQESAHSPHFASSLLSNSL